MSETKTEAKPAIMPSRGKLLEIARRTWCFDLPVGTTVQDVLNPAYWAHCARMPQGEMQPGDHIEVTPDNGTYFAELRVMDCGNQSVKLAVLREVKLEAIEPSATVVVPGHSVEWSGRHTKWRAIRESDRKVLKDGLASRADGYHWLSNYAKALAA